MIYLTNNIWIFGHSLQNVYIESYLTYKGFCVLMMSQLIFFIIISTAISD